jgi:hypothetical protein
MVRLPYNDSDDLQFIDLAERVINGEVALVSADVLHLVQIDSWFGDRWYAFSGKAIGRVEVHTPWRLKVPPFHPHRVVSEARFQIGDPPVLVAFKEPFHTLRSSEENLHNTFGGFAPGGRSSTAGWYSGNSASSGRGSIMVYSYSSTSHGAVGWYAGLERREQWDLVKLVGIDRRHWLTLFDGQAAGR